MNARKTGDLPADLENTRRRLEQWRQRHQAPHASSGVAVGRGGEVGR